MSEVIFEEATLDELLDYLASMEEAAVEEVRERLNDLDLLKQARIAELEAELAASRECHMLAAEQNARNYLQIEELRKELKQIANIAHHGGLTGLDDNDIRRLTLPYWDKDEAALLEAEE